MRQINLFQSKWTVLFWCAATPQAHTGPYCRVEEPHNWTNANHMMSFFSIDWNILLHRFNAIQSMNLSFIIYTYYILVSHRYHNLHGFLYLCVQEVFPSSFFFNLFIQCPSPSTVGTLISLLKLIPSYFVSKL